MYSNLPSVTSQQPSCCNGDKGIYYYTAYENHQITGVDMNKENLNSDKLICYPLIQGEQIKIQNQWESGYIMNEVLKTIKGEIYEKDDLWYESEKL